MTVLARAPGGACAVVPRAGLQAPRVAVRGGMHRRFPRRIPRDSIWTPKRDDMDAYPDTRVNTEW